jgi:parvulin-like peptidyl-prolyl isomerase
MGLMDKFRASTKYILWVLIFSFVILWSLADTQVFDSIVAGPRSLGSVNGEAISFEEYNQTVNNYMQNYQAQTGQSATAELRTYYEELAWDNLVMQKILKTEMDRLGIRVTDEMVVDMINGPNPAPFIAQQFTRADGTIDRAALQQAIEAPENAEIWVNIETQLRDQASVEKLNRYVMNSVKISDAEIEYEFMNQYSTANARFVRFPYSAIADADVPVTDAELNAYIKKHTERYKQEKSYRFRYVSFSKEATTEDSTRVRSEMQRLREAFVQATNDSLFLLENQSATPYNGSFRARNAVLVDLESVFSMQNGQVSEIIESPGRLTVIKRLDSRTGDRLKRLSQIQLPFSVANKEETLVRALEVVQEARRNADFAELVASNSQDFASSSNGGDIGYVKTEDLPTTIADALSSASTGNVVGPVEHEGSFYIFKVTGVETQEVKFAEFTLNIEADPFATVDAQAKAAEDFSFYAREDGYEAEAQRRNLPIQEGFATEGNPFIAGLGQSRVVLNYLARAKANDISDAVDMDNQFLVMEVTEIIPEGTRPLEDIRPQVETLVRNEKRRKLMLDKVTGLVKGQSSLDAIATANGKEVQVADAVTLNNTSLPGAGVEPSVVGTIFGLALNTMSKPIEGESAIYLVQVSNRQLADKANLSDAERAAIRSRLEQSRTATFQQNWIEELKKKADIEDYRLKVLTQQ